MKKTNTKVKGEKKAKKAVKTAKIAKNGKMRLNIFKSILGKLAILGFAAFLTTLALGGAGFYLLSANNANTRMLNSINNINLMQNSNIAAETSFRYLLDTKYNNDIVSNLTKMENEVNVAKQYAGNNYSSKVNSIESKIKEIKNAMQVLSSSYIERGLNPESGLYAKYVENDEALTSGFAALDSNVYWPGLLADANDKFLEYTKAVAEGASTEELAGEVSKALSAIIDNAMTAASDSRMADAVISGVEKKKTAFNEISDTDVKIANTKSMVNTLNSDLTYYCQELQERVAKDSEQALVSMSIIILAVIIGSLIVIITLTTIVSLGVKKNIAAFEGTLSVIAGGDMTAKAKTDAGNEFDAFGESLNKMAGILQGTLSNVRTIATDVNESGNGLQNMAETTSNISNQVSVTIDEIANGATTQAEDVEQSAVQMSELSKYMLNIVDSVSELDSTATDMANAGSIASDIIKELDDSNDKMTEGISKISAQINKTNESVQSIKKATAVIANIASQTNLLSLNASIEAARAGDAGRGFAVVANEIQQLADQSNKSASDIDKVINALIADFKETLAVMAEVVERTGVQNEKLSNTREKFNVVTNGINDAKDKTATIKEAVDECNKVQIKVDQLISNLSAISEEYAASTTVAAQSMNELNDTITNLVSESSKLIEISDTLEESMKAFTL